MARAHTLTPARRAALKKAQAASARKRRGKGKGKLASANRTIDRNRGKKGFVKRNRKKLAYGALAVGAVAGATHVKKNYDIAIKGHNDTGRHNKHVKTGVSNWRFSKHSRLVQARLGVRGRGVGVSVGINRKIKKKK
jgi:hypothetical protein